MTRSKAGSAKRLRRVFSLEFKIEAVRLMRERKALGVPLTQIGRELHVRPDLLRAWARQLDLGPGAAGRAVFPGNGQVPSAEAEVRRLERENAVLRQERDFLKNYPGAPTSPSVGPETPGRIRLHTEWRGRLLFGGRRARKKTWSGGGCGLASGDAARRSRLGK